MCIYIYIYIYIYTHIGLFFTVVPRPVPRSPTGPTRRQPPQEPNIFNIIYICFLTTKYNFPKQKTCWGRSNCSFTFHLLFISTRFG